jgi:hypothetical protein
MKHCCINQIAAPPKSLLSIELVGGLSRVPLSLGGFSL